MIKFKTGAIYEGQIEFYNNGSAILKTEQGEIFIFKKNTQTALHLDTVKVEIFKRDSKKEGRVIEVVSRFKTEFVGRVHKSKNSTFVIPDNNKISVDFYIKGGLIAEDNQKVVVEFTKWTDTKSPQGKIVKILGNSGDNNTEMNSIMVEYGLPTDFPQDVINESMLVSEVISDKEISNRKDIRNITTITIDPVDAKDFDDALSINYVGDKIEVGVHIADVGHYVQPGTKLDEEAYKRGTSVYLVDRCVPMLPERLSNGICSLKPHEDRLAFSVIFTLDDEGNIHKIWQGKTVIHSDHRFTYEQAQAIIESAGVGKSTNEIGRIWATDGGLGNMDFRIACDLAGSVIKLNKLSQKIREKRIKNGSIEMNGIEVRFKLADDNKKPIGVYFKEQKEANKLIEEFMLLANQSVAKTLSDANRANVYRVHDSPNQEKLNSLVSICKTFGYNLNIDTPENIKSSLNELLVQIKGKSEENMIETLVTRCMSKAVYTTKNIGHYGLGFTHYSHFTSPIRRYPDLITHRLLFDFLNNKAPGNPTQIEDWSKWCSGRELVSAKAQRDSIKYKQAEYLLDKIGSSFDGIVSGVTDWGLYVELIDSKCEGMIRYSKLEGDWFIDTNNYLIKNGENVIRLGDNLRVTICSVDLEKKQIDFSL